MFLSWKKSPGVLWVSGAALLIGGLLFTPGRQWSETPARTPVPAPRSPYERAAGRRMSSEEQELFQSDFVRVRRQIDLAHQADLGAIAALQAGLARDFDTIVARAPDFWREFSAFWFAWLKVKDQLFEGKSAKVYLENRLKDHLVSLQELEAIVSSRTEEFVLPGAAERERSSSKR